MGKVPVPGKANAIEPAKVRTILLIYRITVVLEGNLGDIPHLLSPFLIRDPCLGGLNRLVYSDRNWLLPWRPVRWFAERLLRWFGGSPGTRSEPSPGSPAWQPAGGTVAHCVVVCCLIYIVLWNLSTLDPDRPERFAL